MFDLATALWHQQDTLASERERLCRTWEAVGAPTDMPFGQWLQFYALCLDWQPDLIVEVGRAFGNSTCVFLEAAHRLETTSVVSIDSAGEGWSERTRPRLEAIVGPAWFAPLEIQEEDVRHVNLQAIFARGARVLLYWDAHAEDLMDYLLGAVLPSLQAQRHLVIVGDVTDTRYHETNPAYARPDGTRVYWLADLASPFPELVPLYEFLTRNRVPFGTPGHALNTWHQRDPQGADALARRWAADLADGTPGAAGHWLHFSLNDRQEPHYQTAFPRYVGRPAGRLRSLLRRTPRPRGTDPAPSTTP